MLRGAAKLTRAEKKMQRPLQILDAAFEEFKKRGFSATRVEDIADRVGVTKGTVYVYFDTKEKLFEAMIEHVSMPFRDAFESYADAASDPIQRLENLLAFLFDHIVDNTRMRELLRFIVAEGPKFPDLVDRHHEMVMEPVFSRVDVILDAGVSQGKFRRKPQELAKVVVSPVVGMVVFRLIFDDRREVDRKRLLETHVGLLLHGIVG